LQVWSFSAWQLGSFIRTVTGWSSLVSRLARRKSQLSTHGIARL